MHITILTECTLGDIKPLIALVMGLFSVGYLVLLVVPPGYTAQFVFSNSTIQQRATDLGCQIRADLGVSKAVRAVRIFPPG